MKTSDIKQGDILFFSGKGIIKSLIEWITHSKYYHTAIFIDSETLMETQGGRKSGLTKLSDYLKQDIKLTAYRDKSLTDLERNKIITYALHHSGIEYNYLSILAELARYEIGISLDNYDEGRKRICSSFVNDCYEKGIGKELSAQKVPSPQDLAKSKVLKRLGVLKIKKK